MKVVKHFCSWQGLHEWMDQNINWRTCNPHEDIQKTFDLCYCRPGLLYKVLRWTFVNDEILFFGTITQIIIQLQIIQCDFLDVFLHPISHSWSLLKRANADLIFLNGTNCRIGGSQILTLPQCSNKVNKWDKLVQFSTLCTFVKHTCPEGRLDKMSSRVSRPRCPCRHSVPLPLATGADFLSAVSIRSATLSCT